MNRTGVSVATLLACTFAASLNGQQPPAARTIEQVRGDLYKVSSGPGVAAVTVFLVTQDGIILADPLNPEFAAWLKGELATRFPGKPVRFVLQSHYHWDHARGGGMFADTARFIGHENMSRNLGLPIRQAWPAGDTDDVDGDGRLAKTCKVRSSRAFAPGAPSTISRRLSTWRSTAASPAIPSRCRRSSSLPSTA